MILLLTMLFACEEKEVATNATTVTTEVVETPTETVEVTTTETTNVAVPASQVITEGTMTVISVISTNEVKAVSTETTNADEGKNND